MTLLASPVAVGASVIVPVATLPVKVRSLSRIMLDHPCFRVEDCVTGPNGYASEGCDRLTVELFDTKQDVGLVHSLEIEVGADDTISVDDRAAHVGPNFRSVRGLDCTGADGVGRQTVQRSDEEVDQVGCRDTGEDRGVDIGDADCVAPITKHQTDLPLEVISVGL